jgi:CelD/BcsL family acetyltransferase involved in cellulose biosynthesis
MTELIEILRVRELPGIESLAEQWRPLAAAAGNPFLTWEWTSTWWRHFGGERPQQVLGCEDESGALVAIVPLYLHSRLPLRVLRFAGHFPADLLGPVCAPQLQRPALAAVRGHLESKRDWDVLLVERLEAGVADGLGGERLRSEPEPELTLETTDWDEFLAARSSNFRGQTRNRERRLQRDRGLRYRLADDPDRLDEDMETLFGLHEARWQSEGKEGAFGGNLKAFHRDFAHQALANGWLRLWIAYLDEQPAAAWYGFRIGDADWFYQSGRDTGPDSGSIGFVLMAHTVRDAIQSGMSCYKLLLGDETYKSRFANREPAVETFAMPRGVRGRSALRTARAFGRL